ncbi:MAG TPA: DinB family protein [Cyclobacteriaceae bacterium]|nr:DinB family protein [Cyclobacteriaceae bacterium]
MNYTLEQHLAYSVWANETLTNRLRKLDDTLLHKEVNSSFPSIAKTLLHMWGAEILWLKRFQGVSLTQMPLTDFKGTPEDLFNGIIQSSREVQTFVKSRGEDFVKGTVSYKNMKGLEFNDPAESLLYHLVNHGTYHRGQITTMLRTLGITDLASTDIIFYWRSLKK